MKSLTAIIVLGLLCCVAATLKTVWFGKCVAPNFKCPNNFDGYPTACMLGSCYYTTAGPCSDFPGGTCLDPFTCVNSTCYGPAWYGSCDKQCSNDFYQCLGGECVAPTSVPHCCDGGEAVVFCRLRQCEEGFSCSPANKCCRIKTNLPCNSTYSHRPNTG